jgi:hypothetical protein
VFLDPGEGCELGSLSNWVALSVAFFTGGIAPQHSR